MDLPFEIKELILTFLPEIDWRNYALINKQAAVWRLLVWEAPPPKQSYNDYINMKHSLVKKDIKKLLS